MLKSFAVLSLILGSTLVQAASVYEYVNTPALLAGAKTAYHKSVAGDTARTTLIATTQEECGGRYENLDIQAIELSHAIEADKQVINTNNPNNYSLKYTVDAKTTFLVVEKASCSMHGGHRRSVIGSKLVVGTETAVVLYTYVNDNQSGKEKVLSTKRAYTVGAAQLTSEVKTPYSVE